MSARVFFAIICAIVIVSLAGCIEYVPCANNEEVCDGICVDTQTSEKHCGICGHVCDNGSCVNGQCVDKTPLCAPETGLADCSGQCVDLMTNHENCGACGKKCPDGTKCDHGVCADPVACSCDAGYYCDGDGKCIPNAIECPVEMVACGGTCINPNTDERYCGAKGDCQGNNAGRICPSGICHEGMCANVPAILCEHPGDIVCEDSCIDPMTDNQYCGATGCGANYRGKVCSGDLICVYGLCYNLTNNKCYSGNEQSWDEIRMHFAETVGMISVNTTLSFEFPCYNEAGERLGSKPDEGALGILRVSDPDCIEVENGSDEDGIIRFTLKSGSKECNTNYEIYLGGYGMEGIISVGVN